MDLHITIKDENDEVLQNINIYQDGSDSEAVERITEMLEDEFESCKAWLEGKPEARIVIEMDYDQWEESFQPHPTLLETFGDDLVKVKNIRDQKPLNLWTLIEEDGEEYILEGFHYVNRVGYYFTAIPREPETEYTIRVYSEVDC